MKVVLLQIFIIFCLFSCGKGINEQKSGTSIKIGEQMNLNSTVSSEEISQARFLCDKLRSKRMKIMSQSTGKSYDVSLNTKSCDGKISNLTSTVKVSTNSTYIVTGENGVFNKYIETDLEGHFSSVCTDIFAGLEPHLINYVGAFEVIQIQIEGTDKFSIIYGKKNTAGIYVTNDVEVYSFDLRATDKFFATNINFYKKGQCTDPNSSEDSYTKEQILE